MEHRIFEVKLERNEWIKLNFIIAYSNKSVFLISIIGLGMLYSVLDYIFWNSFDFKQFPMIQFISTIIILGVIPISTYLTASKGFNSNPFVSEKALYDFDSKIISVKGESYEVDVHWSNIKTIKELKNWFIVFTEKNQGFFIPKRIFKSIKELNYFRNELKDTPVNEKKLK